MKCCVNDCNNSGVLKDEKKVYCPRHYPQWERERIEIRQAGFEEKHRRCEALSEAQAAEQKRRGSGS